VLPARLLDMFSERARCRSRTSSTPAGSTNQRGDELGKGRQHRRWRGSCLRPIATSEKPPHTQARTFGKMLRAVRDGDELTLEVFAQGIGVSRQNLCDIEKGRKGVSPERAARWARLLGYPEAQSVRLARQAELDAAGLKYRVEIAAA
jgi:DNA-binding XRE family transcriptional regulator